jgi:site-specific DNA recombinase
MDEVVIMARVSSDEQTKGYSLGVQEDSLTKYCLTHDLKVGHFIKEDHSAKSFRRPAFQSFLQLAKKNKGKFSKLLFTTWDRFSRNTTETFAMIERLRLMGIECVAIEQPVDLSIPENKLMLSVYITIPEIDNDRRSIKIRGGMRGALKAGRWSRNAPIGYKNVRDELNKPIIVPNDDAKAIIKAYTLIAKGLSQSEALKEINKGPKKLSKSNISLILRNPVYKGKIIVPKQDKEPEQMIEGLHEGIVSDDLFNKVQVALNRKLGLGINKVKQWNELPLRGFIECSCCGKTLTGSGSKSRSGDKYFYYHCFDGCNERHSATKANEKIEKLISLVQFPKEIAEVIRRTLKDSIDKEQGTNEFDRSELQEKLATLNEQEDNLDNLFLLQKLDSEKYSRLSERIKLEKLETKDQLGNIKTDTSEVNSLIDKAVKNLQIFSKTYLSVGIREKRKMIGSMFPEKIKISDGVLRTTRLNSVMELILLNNKELKGQKKGQNRKKSTLSRLVIQLGFEPRTLSLEGRCSIQLSY